MSAIVRKILYPLVALVAWCFKLALFAWLLPDRRSVLVGFFAFFVGPLLSVLCGLNLVSHLRWEHDLSWSTCFGAFVAIQFALLGVVWPLFVAAFTPLLRVVSFACATILEMIDKLDRSVWRASSKLGSLVPGWTYWKENESGPIPASLWYLFILLIHTFVSLFAHLLIVTTRIWSNFDKPLENGTHFIVLSLFAVSSLLVVGLAVVRIMKSTTAPGVYGPASLLVVLNLLKFTNFLSDPPFDFPFSLSSLLSTLGSTTSTPIIHALKTYIPPLETLFCCIAVYLVTFIFLLPIGGLLSLRTSLFKQIFGAIIRYYNRYRQWANNAVLSNAQFLPYLSLCSSPAAAYATYSIGTFLGLHPFVIWIHVFGLAMLFHLSLGYPTFITALNLLVITQLMIHGVQYLGSHNSQVETIIALITSILCFNFIVVPLLAIPLWPLMKLSYYLPQSLLSVIDWTRTNAKFSLTYTMRKWYNLQDYMFCDRSSFETMFGWLMTTALTIIGFANYSDFFFRSGTSPLGALLQLSSFLIPDLRGIFTYQPLNGTTILDLVNATTPLVNASAPTFTDLGEISQVANFTNSTAASLLETPDVSVLLGHWFIDLLVFLVIASNVLISLGKACSMRNTTAVSFSFVTWLFCFSGFKQSNFMRCHYRSITLLLSAELSFVAAFSLAPATYAIALFFCRPFVPTLAPLICTPYERLWALQVRTYRFCVRHIFAFFAGCRGVVSNIVFGAPKTVRSRKPLYPRPRRYG